jgi:hypothetical protein
LRVRCCPASPARRRADAVCRTLYLDSKDAANAIEREPGAAGRVVQCETKVVGEFRRGRYEGGETGRTPEAGLRTGLDEGAFDGPEDGYLLERREGERALFTIRVDSQVKMAVVLLNGPALGTLSGWHMESWARCNPSEFPDQVTRERGLEIWTDDTGKRVPTYRVVSSAGPEHCDWTSMRFLNLDESDRPYVREPDPEYLDDYFAEDFRARVKLPDNAIDTGLNHGTEHLWLSADRKRAYIGSRGAATVELWPRTTQPFGCA